MATRSKLGKTISSMAKIAVTRGLGLVLAMGVSSLLANRLGTSAPADAFFLARRLAVGFSEAANRISNVMLVPGLVAILSTGDVGRVRKVWHSYQLRAMLWLLPAAGVCALASPWIIHVAGPGLEPDTAHLASGLLRVLLFIIPVTVFRAISGAMLNAGRVFGVPELMAQFSRFLVIMALLLLVPPYGVTFLAWTMLVGSLLAALSLTLITDRSLGRIKPRKKPGTGDSGNGPGRLFLPGLLVFGTNQALIWFEFGIASKLGEGNIATYEYANRLMAILPGLIAASLTTVMYTEFSHQMARGERQEMYRSLARSLRSGLFILAPVVAFLAFQGEAIARLLLHHGRFDAEAVKITARTMHMVAFAGVGTFISRVLLYSVYADKDIKVMRLVLSAMVVKVVARIALVLLLVGPLGVAGIALGRSLSILVRMLVIFLLLYKVWGRFLRLSDIRNMILVLVITAVSMGSTLYLNRLMTWTMDGSFWIRLLGVSVAAVVGFGLFLGLSALVRLPELKALKGMIRSRKAA